MVEKNVSDDIDNVNWNDVEALPLYAAAMLFVGAVVFALVHDGSALEATTMKVAMIFGCLGLRWAWLGMDGESDDA